MPTFATLPEQASYSALSLDDVDGEPIVYLFDGGGVCTEADGTRYAPSVSPSGAMTVTETLRDGRGAVGASPST